jgi:hypothetical protein
VAELAICSLVRDGMPYLPAYRRQLESLVLTEGDSWRLYCVEGDSRDDSWSFLQSWAREDTRVTLAQLPVGKAESAEQMAQNWAKVCNACFGLIPADSTHTHVLWLESDLTFPSETARRLQAHGVDIVAPIIFLGGQFYDTWGFRDVEGRRWTNEAPYHRDFAPNRLLPMGSVGSCVLFRRAVFEAGIRMRGTYENGLLVGMCNDARAAGFSVWADTGTAILHPVDQWERQMWRVEEVTIEGPRGAQRLAPVDFQRENIVPIVAVLDASALIGAQCRFLARQFVELRTNRLEIGVAARTHPTRRFTMNVRRGSPRGIGALPAVMQAMSFGERFWRKKLCPQHLVRASEPSARGFRPFRCQVQITMETAP